LILAVGGGSVIDSAKVISATIPVDHSAWEFYGGDEKPKTAIPLIAVLTLAATGTEMNPFAVVQNNATKEKLGWGNNHLYPRHSFLDPQYTVSVPRDYTAYGIADLMVHCTEAYFDGGDASLSDRFVFSILKEAVEYGPQLLEDLNNYELRARIMYAATAALNKLTMHGRIKGGDWGVHQLGHVLSMLYDIPHGASLTIILPAWMKYFKKRLSDKIARLGQNVFGTETADDAIESFESFFKGIGCPVRLSECGIQRIDKNEILEGMAATNPSGNEIKLNSEDYPKLIDLFQ
jgi:alcohol dehydrogenase YqhD (iron-dependent ADH family)